MSDVRTRRRRHRTRSHYRDPLGALTVAAIAYLAVLLLVMLVVPRIPVLGEGGWVTQLVAFLIVWSVLAAAVVYAGARYGSRSLRADAGFSIRWIDLGIGLLTGLVARFVVEGLAPADAGRAALDGDGAAMPPTPAMLVIVIGVALVAPVVEELFFRGLLQRAVSGMVPGGRWARISVAVLVSTPLFVLLHLASAAPAAWGSVVITSGIGGALFGLLAAATRRLGTSIAAHVVFNVLGLVFLYAR